MISNEIREARLAANLTVSEVARRAGVPRQQVRTLESGGNVTLETMRRIVPVIPNLRRVTLGGMEILADNIDLEEARRAALDLFDVTKRLVAALGAAPPSQASRPPAVRSDPAVHAVQPDRASAREREIAERLERRIPELKRRANKQHS